MKFFLFLHFAEWQGDYNNIQCQQLCLLKPSGSLSAPVNCVCKCKTGYILNHDNKTCSSKIVAEKNCVVLICSTIESNDLLVWKHLLFVFFTEPNHEDVYLLYGKRNPGEIKGVPLFQGTKSTNVPVRFVENLQSPRAMDLYRLVMFFQYGLCMNMVCLFVIMCWNFVMVDGVACAFWNTDECGLSHSQLAKLFYVFNWNRRMSVSDKYPEVCCLVLFVSTCLLPDTVDIW